MLLVATLCTQTYSANATLTKPINVPNVTVYKIKLIAIQLSNSCLASLRDNSTTKCPTYDSIVKYDTTNPRYSGKFVTMNGHLYRDSEKKVSDSIYRFFNEYVICVDCRHTPLSKYKQIFIEPSLRVFRNQTANVITNNTVILFHGRGIDTNCRVATIEYSDFLLNDTINYLKSDCKQTAFNGTQVYQRPYTKFDISTSQAFKNAVWLKAAMKISKTTNCIKSTVC